MFWRMSVVFLQIEKEKQQPRLDFFEEMKNNHIFKRILTKTNVLVSSRIRFKEERTGGHLLTSYHLWYVRGAVACFIFKVFQNLYPEIGSGATLSFCDKGH